jgi:hypothetical protein
VQPARAVAREFTEDEHRLEGLVPLIDRLSNVL